MFYTKRKVQLLVLLLLFFVICAFGIDCYFSIKQYPCLGIRMFGYAVENAEAGGDDGFELLFNGVMVPYDKKGNTFYIAQNIDKRLWEGKLTATDPSYTLYFLADGLFSNKAEAIRSSHAFTLFAERNNQYYKYNVIFTSLPVLNITAWGETALNEWIGEMHLFDPNTSANYQIQSSDLVFRVRGYSSSTFVKKGYKLNLKDAAGNNRNLNLLGMHKDDDWILSALYTDDQKIREKLVQDIWNTMAETSGSKFKPKFARSEYVEVVINNQHMGLYTLGTRLDAKYEGVDAAKATLFQIKYYFPINEDDWLGLTDESEYVGPLRLMSSPEKTEGWRLIQDFSRQYIQADWPFEPETAVNMIDIDNQIDSYLTCQYAWLADNQSTNNVFYIVLDGKYYRTLWDMDKSWGNQYRFGEKHEPVHFGQDETVYDNLMTMEMEKLLAQDESLWEKICERYRELRSGVFDPQTVNEYVDLLRNDLDRSGALIREAALYPDGFVAPDASWLKDWINRRVEFLDELFQYSERGESTNKAA